MVEKEKLLLNDSFMKILQKILNLKDLKNQQKLNLLIKLNLLKLFKQLMMLNITDITTPIKLHLIVILLFFIT